MRRPSGSRTLTSIGIEMRRDRGTASGGSAGRGGTARRSGVRSAANICSGSDGRRVARGDAGAGGTARPIGGSGGGAVIGERARGGAGSVFERANAVGSSREDELREPTGW